MSSAPRDILDVKDEIKRLRIKRSALLAENIELTSEIGKPQSIPSSHHLTIVQRDSFASTLTPHHALNGPSRIEWSLTDHD